MVFKDKFIQFVEDLLDDSGKNRTAGTIYAHLLLDQQRVTQQQLQDKLQVSNATISRCINVLEEKGRLLTKQRVPGSRVLEYELADDTYRQLVTYPLKQQIQQYNRAINQLELLGLEATNDEEKETIRSMLHAFQQAKKVLLKSLSSF